MPPSSVSQFRRRVAAELIADLIIARDRDRTSRWTSGDTRGRRETVTVGCMEEDAIRELVTRLARADPSGGTVIERAAILAAGTDVAAVMEWIVERGGKPQALAETTTSRGLHGPRSQTSGLSAGRPPSRFVLPPGALD
jgi:hypothetical protein